MTTIGVCGFGRCGSTMMMHLLSEGGIPSHPQAAPISHETPFDVLESDPRCDGHAVKLLDSILRFPLPEGDWRFIWIDRDPTEQARSMVKFVAGIARVPLGPDAATLFRRSFVADRPVALRKLRKHGPILALRYEEALSSPQMIAQRVGRFLRPGGFDLDMYAASEAIHRRSPKCRPDLSFEASGLAIAEGVTA